MPFESFLNMMPEFYQIRILLFQEPVKVHFSGKIAFSHFINRLVKKNIIIGKYPGTYAITFQNE
jgi:hypothetical protein